MDWSLESLRQIEAIRLLKARYFRTLDGKDWEGYAALFTDEATIDVHEDLDRFAAHGFPLSTSADEISRTVIGATKLTDFVRQTVGSAKTVHHGHMPEIHVLGPNRATGIWAMADIVEGTDMMLRGEGHYHESYRRVGADWLIANLRLSRLRIDFFTPDGRGGWRQATGKRHPASSE